MITAKLDGEATITRTVSMFHRLPPASHTELILLDPQENALVTTHQNRGEKPDDLPPSVRERPKQVITSHNKT